MFYANREDAVGEIVSALIEAGHDVLISPDCILVGPMLLWKLAIHAEQEVNGGFEAQIGLIPLVAPFGACGKTPEELAKNFKKSLVAHLN